MSNYFSIPELEQLQSFEGRVLKRVLYHHWVNRIKPGEAFEFLDMVELAFDEGNLVFGTSEENDGICPLPGYDVETARLRLLHEFGGKIDLRTVDMTHDPLWLLAPGQPLHSIELVKDREGLYRNDCLMLDFDKEKMEVRLGVEGLIVEPFEDI